MRRLLFGFAVAVTCAMAQGPGDIASLSIVAPQRWVLAEDEGVHFRLAPGDFGLGLLQPRLDQVGDPDDQRVHRLREAPAAFLDENVDLVSDINAVVSANVGERSQQTEPERTEARGPSDHQAKEVTA